MVSCPLYGLMCSLCYEETISAHETLVGKILTMDKVTQSDPLDDQEEDRRILRLM